MEELETAREVASGCMGSIWAGLGGDLGGYPWAGLGGLQGRARFIHCPAWSQLVLCSALVNPLVLESFLLAIASPPPCPLPPLKMWLDENEILDVCVSALIFLFVITHPGISPLISRG